MKRFLLSISLIFILYIASASFTGIIWAQEKIDRPEWKIGDQWTYQRGEQQLTSEVIAIEKLKKIEYYVIQRLANKIFFTKDIEYWMTKRASDDFVIIQYDPPQKLFSWPLELKKKWKQTLRLYWDTTKFGIDGFNWHPDPVWRESKVMGIEKITVPAGTFLSVHVYTTETLGGVTVDFHRWYAPEVKNVVWAKGYTRGVPWEEKLISYSLK